MGRWLPISRPSPAPPAYSVARAAQAAGEGTTRRFEVSKDKGSAASAVACFMRDMMTLRQGLEIMQSAPGGEVETPSFQQAVQPPQAPFSSNTSPLRGGFAG